MIGKQIRMERIIDRNSGKTVMIPMDHGITMGPIVGLIDMKRTVDAVASGGANAIIIHKGVVTAGHRGKGRDIGLIVHLSASTALAPDPNSKTLVCEVEEAIKLGADAVSLHVNLGASDEKEMLRDFGLVAQKASEWGFPLVAMVYTRGARVKDEFDPQMVKHAARLGAELGADIVKVNYTGSPESFRQVVEGCFVPVVIAGGPKMEGDRAVLEMVKGAMEAGAGGASIGRNAFQHRDPTRIVRAISSIVHEGASVEEALRVLEEGR